MTLPNRATARQARDATATTTGIAPAARGSGVRGLVRGAVASSLLLLVVGGCQPSPMEAASRSERVGGGSTMGPSAAPMDPEELRSARAQAGFKTPDERSAEEAARVEVKARRQVLAQLDAYRDFVREFRRVLGRLERAAPRWETARDFDRFQRGYGRHVRSLDARFQALQASPGPHGETFARAEQAFRAWEDLNTGLGPMRGATTRFDRIVGTLRANLAALSRNLDDIEGDERLILDGAALP